jgi:hypothetical protein
VRVINAEASGVSVLMCNERVTAAVRALNYQHDIRRSCAV